MSMNPDGFYHEDTDLRKVRAPRCPPHAVAGMFMLVGRCGRCLYGTPLLGDPATGVAGVWCVLRPEEMHPSLNLLWRVTCVIWLWSSVFLLGLRNVTGAYGRALSLAAATGPRVPTKTWSRGIHQACASGATPGCDLRACGTSREGSVCSRRVLAALMH